MKRLIILILAIIPFLSCCEKENDTNSYSQIRKIAWNSLIEHVKSTVIIYWEDAPVNETTCQGENAYTVSFNTSEDSLLGLIIICIEKTTLVVLGNGLRI